MNAGVSLTHSALYTRQELSLNARIWRTSVFGKEDTTSALDDLQQPCIALSILCHDEKADINSKRTAAKESIWYSNRRTQKDCAYMYLKPQRTQGTTWLRHDQVSPGRQLLDKVHCRNGYRSYFPDTRIAVLFAQSRRCHLEQYQ